MPEGVDFPSAPLEFFIDTIFDINGPYGAYGKIDDVKVIQATPRQLGRNTYRMIDISFSTLTPTAIQPRRRACISTTAVGNDAYMLVGSIDYNRWRRVRDDVAEMVLSFRAAKAPPRRIRGSENRPMSLGELGYVRR